MSDNDLLPSPMSTPPSMRSSAVFLPPPSPLARATLVPSDPDQDSDLKATENESTLSTSLSPKRDLLEGIPALKTYPASSDADKTSALKLVADSVAQQRQTASRSLILHPVSLAVWFLVLVVVWRYVYTSSSDIGIILTTYSGLAMGALAGVRWATSGYIVQAEWIGWEWLDGDEVLVTRFGDAVIGACVFRWTVEKQRRKKVGRIWIRAWTVGLKWRGKGVGGGLLDEVRRECRRRDGEGVWFDEGHANSARMLPGMFNGAFESREQRARDKLKTVMDADVPSWTKR